MKEIVHEQVFCSTGAQWILSSIYLFTCTHFCQNTEPSRVLHSLCTVYPLKKPQVATIHSCTWYSWQPVQSIFHLRSPWFGSCLQSSLVLQSADCFLERNDVLCHPVFSLHFCRSEFSLYHHLHGRHFLTHHLGDCVCLLETLQKVPVLLSLSTLFDRSKASHDKSKPLALWL